ncbi:MAG TPA: hypothetical protein VK817_02610 [Trebonia sp.]|nr:hypothetical protein [Trebonia sp.]
MPEADELLREAGEVPPPEPRVLDGAREALWSVIAGEMLGQDNRGPARRRQADRPQDGRGKSVGGRE